ncbi:MAG: DNA recombination protein RmuC [Kiritimatiellae bacterium]|nr:DNA recombination protein RmuC [Kiritimatiellia bacterium]
MPDLLIPILIGLLLLVILGLALWMGAQLRALKPHPDDQKAIAELKGQVGAFAMQVENLRQSLTTQQSQVIQSLTTTRDAMDKRLDGAARTMAEVSKNLGQLTVATKQLEEVGKDISSLQDILRAPKLRGNLGELFLGDLLAQILPTEHFELQYGFKGGEAVDAVVKLNAGLVPVDAKFPLESFKRILATESDEAKKAPRREFIRDVKKHVDAIADKYIRPDEGTFDFALMYIPAENVYYETIIKDDEFGGDSALF